VAVAAVAGWAEVWEEAWPRRTGKVAVGAAAGVDAIISISYTFYYLYY